MFPLNTVVFPGLNVPLHVFEERYVALVRDLLARPAGSRVFGSVAIREGYEVGDHGAQSLYRVGCRLLLTDVEEHGNGTFDVLGIGIDRFALDRLDGGGPFPSAGSRPGPRRASTSPRRSSRTRARSSPPTARRSGRSDTTLSTTPSPGMRWRCRGRSRPARHCRCRSGRSSWRPTTSAPG
jgi:hypothetical protein